MQQLIHNKWRRAFSGDVRLRQTNFCEIDNQVNERECHNDELKSQRQNRAG